MLFVERGFHATPTLAITKAAGVSAGILFHYFKTKDKLIQTLFIETKLEFYQTALSGHEKINSVEGKMRLIWSNLWKYGVENNHKYKFMKQFHNSPFISQVMQDPSIQNEERNLHELIQRGIDKKVLKDIPIELHQYNSYNLVISLVDLIDRNNELQYDNTFIAQAWECYWDCLKA